MPILNTIEISNFKSFKGKTVISPIPRFLAIIGPNGSGKSNIMDAISFALGEKASALRVKRLNQLIHGFPLRQSMTEGIAYVKLVFIGDDINDKSFTRMIHGETNQYKIDNKVVTDKFYMTELRQVGLDIKAGNFLIPQGCIEHFALKMPKALTIMFEQTCNSIAYKADYERLKSELLKVEDETHLQHQMLKQLRVQKKNATVEKAETKEYLQLQEEYNKRKLKCQLIRLLLIQKKMEFLEDIKRKIKSDIDEHQRNKKFRVILLKEIQIKFKSLSIDHEVIEENIIEMENSIQKKKTELAIFEENISYWKNKHSYAIEFLYSASKARETKQKVIQELEDELKQINNKLTELRKASQTSIIELSDCQVKRYMELTIKVECQAKDFVEQINNLLHNKQEDHDKLDNANRRKQELEDKVKQIRLKKKNLETRLKRLQDLNAESKVLSIEKKKIVDELNQKIYDTKDKSLRLENAITKIREQLSEIDIGNRQHDKNETIKKLKQLYSGVYGRLSNLCKPIHERYNVATTKVFGKKMEAIIVDTKHTAIRCIEFLKEHRLDIETFLPLDTIKTVHLNEQLRTIKEPRNVKLLYDVLNISPEINKAVLFVTKNTLVCETVKDAQIIAQSREKWKAQNCVSLDGCFYRKDGIISGGQADLIKKAKQWVEQDVLQLSEQKTQLTQELRNLPKISLKLQFEREEITVQINELEARNKYIEIDIKDTMAIVEVRDNIQKRDKRIEKIKKRINAIKDVIFVDFCKDINVPNISYYEENNLRIYQEQKKRQMELEQQHDRIKNQLRFENEDNTESKVLKWQRTIEQMAKADAELNKIYRQEEEVKIKLVEEEADMSALKKTYGRMERDLQNVQEELNNCKLQISNINKLYLNKQKEHIAVQRKIEQKKIECKTILKECQMENIIIPMSKVSGRRSKESSSSSSNSIAESFGECDVLSEIDFLQFPNDIRNCTNNDLLDALELLNEELARIKAELKNVANPNLKIDEKIDSIVQEIQEISTNLQNCRKNYDEINAQFELVKRNRYNLFSSCLENITAEVDSICKVGICNCALKFYLLHSLFFFCTSQFLFDLFSVQNLVNDRSAQAIILPDNPEEPYTGNVIYNCMVPSKNFLPMQCLSGGEKSLASLALLFAIQRYKKIPFVIMDECDAALDKMNIKNVTRFIQSQNTMQFIMISLHKELFYNTDALVAVAMQHRTSCPHSEVFGIVLSGYHY
ncbi:structural maintenance of chromosomes protein 1A isoform X2 [Solenopsis invicta]|uniref:structural maintenance of chromosomes protein 1A isoform X2 n=1 Tax=Solenopsis invicta TaxID=13686 RepID=UPI00193E2124|nr:structural maintenance of chromosomes protein 1A isoform X2 [Solenopsis invicta]